MRWSLIASLAAGIGLILLVAFTGDSDAVDPRNVQENVAAPAGQLDAAHTIGQSFVFHYPRLRAIAVRWIVSDDLHYASQSLVVMHLRRGADDPSDIATASVALSALRNNEFTEFSFSPIQDSQDRSFYFFLDASQAEITRGYISVWASDENDYPGGQMDENGVAANRALAFRAYYAPDLPLALGALERVVERYFIPSLLAVCIFLIPGLAFVFLSGNFGARHLVETIALANGLGLGALSAASLLLLALRAPVQWLGVVVAAGLLAALITGGRALLRQRSTSTTRGTRQSNFVYWLLAALAVLSIAVAFLQIRDMLVPLWKDAPIHAQTISNILAQGHLPTDFFYHLGFHSIAALLTQSSGATIPVAMLVLGQLLITQTGLSVFLLCKRLSGSEIAALVSAACVWFLSPTPSYFVTWGRYPLLLGGALFPLALLFAIEYIERPRFDAWTYFLVVIISAGLAFAHVRLVVFALIFAAIFVAGRLVHDRGTFNWRSLLARIVLVMVAGFALAGMWLASLTAPGGALLVTPQNVLDYAVALDLPTAIAVLLAQHGPVLLAVAAVGVVVALLRRHRDALIVVAWLIALLAISALPVIGEKYLPAALVVLIGFVPASIIVGDLADFLYARTVAQSSRAAVMWGATILIVSALGAQDMISIVNPATILFTDADQNAMTWIEAHSPANSRFLINSDAWFGGGYSPTDGGGWIPYLTGRAIDFVDQPNAPGIPTAETASRWIDTRRIDWIYLGRRSGILKKSDFVCQPERYALIYNQDGIAIFQVRSDAPARRKPRAGCAAD